MGDIWEVVHAERAALCSDLRPLSDEQWEAPSLCTQWTVRDVVAHMTATAKISGGTFFPKLVGAGFSLSRMQTKDIAVEKGSSPTETLERFEAVQTSKRRPPGPADTVLGETIVHGEDIRRALATEHEYPADALVKAADFYKRSNLIIGAKRRIAGLTLCATDVDWRHGEGPEVSGPMLVLLMAMTGRKAVLGDLGGDGVQVLEERA